MTHDTEEPAPTRLDSALVETNLPRIAARARSAALIGALLLACSPARTLAVIPGQLVVDPEDPSRISYAGGGSFFLCAPGEPEGFLYRGSINPDGTRNGDQDELLDILEPTGANGVYLMAVRSHGGDGGPTQNPFVDNDPDLGLNEAVLAQWDQWFTRMDDSGIVIFFFLYDDGARIWGTSGNFNAAEEQALVSALVNRFEHHRHLIWVIAEEYAEKWETWEISALAAMVREADDHDHPIAVHQNHGLSFHFGDDPNIDQFAIQYNNANTSNVHNGILTAWAEANGRYNLNLSEADGWGTGNLARRNAWAAAMAGAYVMHFNWDIESTPTARLRECGALKQFFEAAPLADVMPMDFTALGATEYVLANPGGTYVAYTASNGSLGISNLPAGQPVVRWLDTVSGETVTAVINVSGGDTFLTRPAGFGGEVALQLVYGGATIFTDGFESGTTSAWPQVAP